MMVDMLDIVVNEVERMETGVCFTSPSRYGKTKAIDYIMEKLKDDLPTVTQERVIMTTRSLDTDKKFFAHLLTSFSNEEAPDRYGDELRGRIQQLLLIRCAETQDPRVVLFFDEAQRLTHKNFSNLIDLTNHLEGLGLAPTVLLVGQPELLDLRTELKRNKRKDIIGRFLDNSVSLDVVNNLDTFSKILNQYDDYKCAAFPGNSRKCITAAYVGDLYRKGFRVGSVSEAAWDAFTDVSKAFQLEPSFGMKTLTRVIEAGLSAIAVAGTAEDAKKKEWWLSILQHAGYVRHLTAMSNDALPV
jgi:hypothetical protein